MILRGCLKVIMLRMTTFIFLLPDKSIIYVLPLLIQIDTISLCSFREVNFGVLLLEVKYCIMTAYIFQNVYTNHSCWTVVLNEGTIFLISLHREQYCLWRNIFLFLRYVLLVILMPADVFFHLNSIWFYELMYTSTSLYHCIFTKHIELFSELCMLWCQHTHLT